MECKFEPLASYFEFVHAMISLTKDYLSSKYKTSNIFWYQKLSANDLYAIFAISTAIALCRTVFDEISVQKLTSFQLRERKRITECTWSIFVHSILIAAGFYVTVYQPHCSLLFAPSALT